MKVNIKGKWHDAELEPIQIELTKQDKWNIANMDKDAMNYISFPDKMSFDKVKSILKINK
jgi:hypothetical protein